MRFPSKVTSFKESSISKFSLLLNILYEESISPYELYEQTKNKFGSIEEFIDALDCLYALDKITLDVETGRITNAT